MKIYTAEIIDDLKGAAFLEGELHPELDVHRRHEMADICEPPNIDRIWRLISLHASEIRVILSMQGHLKHNTPRHRERPPDFTATNELETPKEIRLRLPPCIPESIRSVLKEKTHDYILSRLMADRCAVIIPTSAPYWNSRAEDAISQIRSMINNASLTPRPVRRPLPPL